MVASPYLIWALRTRSRKRCRRLPVHRACRLFSAPLHCSVTCYLRSAIVYDDIPAAVASTHGRAGRVARAAPAPKIRSHRLIVRFAQDRMPDPAARPWTRGMLDGEPPHLHQPHSVDSFVGRVSRTAAGACHKRREHDSLGRGGGGARARGRRYISSGSCRRKRQR